MFTKRSALLLAALLVAAAISLPAAVAAASATVRITDRLEPATVRVTAGTTVTWRNDSGERHRMRSVDREPLDGDDLLLCRESADRHGA